ncbi:MAG: hypothetical protein ACTS40_02070 [Candidatus Hodgkinia cicadicola]
MHGWDCNPMVSGWKDGLCCVRNRGGWLTKGTAWAAVGLDL